MIDHFGELDTFSSSSDHFSERSFCWVFETELRKNDHFAIFVKKIVFFLQIISSSARFLLFFFLNCIWNSDVLFYYFMFCFGLPLSDVQKNNKNYIQFRKVHIFWNKMFWQVFPVRFIVKHLNQTIILRFPPGPQKTIILVNDHFSV